MKDSSTVAAGDSPSVDGSQGEAPATDRKGLAAVAHGDVPGAPPVAHGGRAGQLPATSPIGADTVGARLRGGPAAGRHVEVPRIAGAFPMFIGVEGANYVRDRGSGEPPVYNWWPAGASAPAGDPSARTADR